MPLIDPEMVRAQFDGLDPAIAARLRDAIRSDLGEWGGALCRAWEQADQAAIGRARHALAGLCGNFGAEALLAAAREDLAAEPDRVRFGRCLEDSIVAILAAAGVAG